MERKYHFNPILALKQDFFSSKITKSSLLEIKNSFVDPGPRPPPPRMSRIILAPD